MTTKMTTITGRELKISSNQKMRTYTIRTESGKYRTCQMSKEEFDSARWWTGNDWQQFLSATDDYYIVKEYQ